MEKQFDNTIVMFDNDTKGNDKAPIFKGKLTVNGVDKEFALWAKEKDGRTFFSGKITDPYVKPTQDKLQDPLKKDREVKHDDMQEDYGDLPF